MPDRSAVIVPIAIPPRLAMLRDAGDPMAARGVPAHVTVLFPFLPAGALTAAVRTTLARLAATHPPFIARFDEVDLRDDMVWLVPSHQQPFRRLTEAVVATWPDFPPYGGTHDELIAHLTLIGTADAGGREAVRSAARDVGRFDVVVGELTVIAEDGAGTWRTQWHLPLGPGSDPPER
jgi:hypothetical protein